MARTGYRRMLLVGAAAALGWLAATAGPAEATFIFTMQEQGPDVVVTGSGSLDLAGLTLFGAGSLSSGMIPDVGFLAVGGDFDAYDGFSGPSSFGTTNVINASSASGDTVLIAGPRDFLGLPPGYVSGAALVNSMTFAGQTFASLGVIPGTYVWSWPADSLILRIGATAVPEPAAALLVGAGLLGLAALHRRRNGST